MQTIDVPDVDSEQEIVIAETEIEDTSSNQQEAEEQPVDSSLDLSQLDEAALDALLKNIPADKLKSAVRQRTLSKNDRILSVREFMRSVQKEYPCPVLSNGDQVCGSGFDKKSELRAHLLDDVAHTTQDVLNATEA